MKLFLVSGAAGRSLQAADRHIKQGRRRLRRPQQVRANRQPARCFFIGEWGAGVNPDLLTHAPVSLVVGLIDLISLGGGYET